MTPVRELNKYHVRVPVIGMIVSLFTFLCGFTGVLWAIFSFYTRFEINQEKMYAAIQQHGVIMDSVKVWHVNGLAHRSKTDIHLSRVDTTLKLIMAAMNVVEPAPGIGLFTEKRIHGHIVFEKLPNTTK